MDIWELKKFVDSISTSSDLIHKYRGNPVMSILEAWYIKCSTILDSGHFNENVELSQLMMNYVENFEKENNDFCAKHKQEILNLVNEEFNKMLS